MHDHVNFLDLKTQGEVMFLSVDRDNVHMIYRDHIDSAEYYFLLSKDFVIEAAVELEIPELVGSLQGAFWFDITYSPDRSPRFAGETTVNGKFYSFKFDRQGHVWPIENVLSMKPKVSDKCQALLPKDFVVEHMTSYKGHTFLVGLDQRYHEQTFVHVKTTDEGNLCISRLYYLKHGFGDLKVNTIALDVQEKRVYLGGEILFFDEDDYVCSEFFIDNFSFH